MAAVTKFLVELWVGKPYVPNAQAWLRVQFNGLSEARSVYADPRTYLAKMGMQQDIERLDRVTARCWVALYAEGIIDLERTYLPPEAAPAVEPPTPQPGGRPVLRIVRD